ncbi:MAG: exodeoxyribonuclease VII small subunit [Acidimicrobiia bacterium]|nr:exodeoxyribonuclease VII small subunit [Acidimicrobiia bacterium]MYA39570.1 exodeoxyribonuclease VII small subunit [Acidimicrobiia bacterium]MYB79043.1 exodeoxyribonuclease VII small subunit [Acidimicrobiia bacterium]MYH06440.1 exodeoxyribonuclease VII small subunit [Acidimicrobiia bacterium]
MSESPPPEKTPPSYAEGLAELEEILDYLQGSEVDLEAMAEKVERAGALIQFCRQRLDDVSLQVNDVLESVKAALEEEQ